MVSTSVPELTPRDIIRAVIRQRRKAVVFFVAVMIAVTGYLMLASREYQSEGKLFVLLGRENTTLGPTATLGQGQEPVVAVPMERESEINSVVDLLSSRVLKEAIVDEIGADRILAPGSNGIWQLMGLTGRPRPRSGPPDPTPQTASANDGPFRPTAKRERAVRTLTTNLYIQPVRKSNVVLIQYTGQSPELAQSIVSTLIDKYLDEHVRLNRPRGSQRFLTEQAERAREGLQEAETSLKELMAVTGLVAPNEQRAELVSRIGRLEEELAMAMGDIAASEEKIQKLRTTLDVLPEREITSETTGMADQGTDAMRQRYYDLQLKELELRSRYTDSHPMVKEIQQQVAIAEEILDREQSTRTEIKTEADRAYTQTELDLIAEEPRLAALKVRSECISQLLANGREELKRLNENQARVTKMQREIQIQEAKYVRYSTSLEQARIDEAMKLERISNINIAQPATFQMRPVSPHTKPTLLFGLMFAAFGAFGLIFLAEYFDRTLKKPDDLEKAFGGPVLVAVPRLQEESLIFNGRN